MRNLFRAIALAGGGVAIIASAVYTLGHLSDHTVFTVLIPGFVAGLILIGLYMAAGTQRKEEK